MAKDVLTLRDWARIYAYAAYRENHHTDPSYRCLLDDDPAKGVRDIVAKINEGLAEGKKINYDYQNTRLLDAWVPRGEEYEYDDGPMEWDEGTLRKIRKGNAEKYKLMPRLTS